METLAYYTLKTGIALTFLLTSYFIFKDPNKWEDVPLPWFKKLDPLSPKTTMILTAVYDMLNGLWLLSEWYVWLAAIFATIHMILVLMVAGINRETYRDIGILASCIALVLYTLPPYLRFF